MTLNESILNLLKEIMPKEFGRKIWQLEYLPQYIMANPKIINNLSKGAYQATGDKYCIDSGSVDKNISRLIPYIDAERLADITGRDVDIEALTPAKLVDIMIMYLKEDEYTVSS